MGILAVMFLYAVFGDHAKAAEPTQEQWDQLMIESVEETQQAVPVIRGDGLSLTEIAFESPILYLVYQHSGFVNNAGNAKLLISMREHICSSIDTVHDMGRYGLEVVHIIYYTKINKTGTLKTGKDQCND